MTTDSDNFSVSSLDAKKQENQIVLYEGVQPLAICDDEEKQAKKPDPDGVSVNVFMLKGVNSITTDGKEEDNDEMLLEEDADGRFISFKVQVDGVGFNWCGRKCGGNLPKKIGAIRTQKF